MNLDSQAFCTKCSINDICKNDSVSLDQLLLKVDTNDYMIASSSLNTNKTQKHTHWYCNKDKLKIKKGAACSKCLRK